MTLAPVPMQTIVCVDDDLPLLRSLAQALRWWAWGGIACGIFGNKALGGLGGVSLGAQLIGTAMGVGWALLTGVAVYGIIKATMGLRMTQEEEYEGADLSIHRIGSTPDREVNW